MVRLRLFPLSFDTCLGTPDQPFFAACFPIPQEALPSPFGLVRSGVAPDHQDTKNVINQFTALARDPRVTFFGNVRVGNSGPVSLAELRSYYNAVVLAYGAESDRRLGLAGESRLDSGLYSAREFVWWYNGHPSASTLPIDLKSATSVAVCGLGNVALDCARVLLRPWGELSTTDAASHAINVLRESNVKQVHLIGRRGPAQAAFTPKELRELLNLPGINVRILPDGCLNLSPACQEEVSTNRVKRRIVEVMQKSLVRPNQGDDSTNRSLYIHFYRSPHELVCDNTGKLSGLQLERTMLSGNRAIGTGEFETLPIQMLLTSIGYKSLPMEGAPFDEKRGIIPNVHGQVVTETTETGLDPGLFVCGWIKRGPTGIIGTNLIDAEDTVEMMVKQKATFPSIHAVKPGGEGLASLLQSRGCSPISFADWEKIDSAEKERGTLVGKPREKFTSIHDMVDIARGSHQSRQ